ncbi:MAG: hypothetical protein JWM02_1255 [Frankiales bacterium]|nr:hypothetical protein [Frankiales bacterium]
MSSWTSPPPGRDEPGRRAPAPSARQPEPHLHGGDHHAHLPAGAHIADRRGLTATGAVTIALALGVAGAAIDVNTGRGLRATFAICFVLGSALAALLVHREDLKATVVMPPLTYCVLALVGAALGHTQVAGSFVKAQGLELVSALIIGAPVLYVATGSAFLIALVRAFRGARQP